MTGAGSRFVLLAGLATLASVAAATARAAPVPLPSVLVQTTLEPPFPAPVTGGENEGGALRFPARSAQRVTVAIDGEGMPFAVRVRQRLTLLRAGDYSFVIGAPVEDVRAAPGSESEPGLRNGAVLWAGFSAGRKLLAADVVLMPKRAAHALPLRVDVSRTDEGVRVRVTNTTRVSVRALSGNATPIDAARALDAVRQEGDDPRAPTVILDFRGTPTSRPATVAAPLRVRASIAFPPGALDGATVRGGVVQSDAVRFDTVLGDETPLAHDVVVRGTDAAPKLDLVATPQPPVRLVEPPAGRSWVEFVRGTTVRGRELVSRVISARLAFARARQYQTFLADPDPLGPRAATYRYVTAERPASAPPTTATTESSGSSWLPLALVPLALLAAAGLVVLWAHS